MCIKKSVVDACLELESLELGFFSLFLNKTFSGLYSPLQAE